MSAEHEQGGQLTSRISRRRFLAKSAAAGAVAWATPAIVSLPGGRAWAHHYPGQPKIQLRKTVGQAIRNETTLTVSGNITISNDTGGPNPAVIETITDRVEYRVSGSDWQSAPTSVIGLPCAPGTSLGKCSGGYNVQATVPVETKTLRNVVEVTVFYRNKTFLFRGEAYFTA